MKLKTYNPSAFPATPGKEIGIVPNPDINQSIIDKIIENWDRDIIPPSGEIEFPIPVHKIPPKPVGEGNCDINLV